VDEEMLVFPAEWTRVFLPRRGGRPGPSLPTGRAAVAKARKLIGSDGDRIEQVLSRSGTDETLAVQARAWLADMSTGTPLGAATVALAAVAWTRYMNLAQFRRVAVLVDAWVALRGVVFACEAVLEMPSIRVDIEWPNTDRPRLIRASPDWAAQTEQWQALIARVRAHLAVATDDDYGRAETVLAARRATDPGAAYESMVLMPTRADWVDDAFPKAGMLSAGTVEQVARLSTFLGLFDVSLPMLVTAVDGAGPGIAPVIMNFFDGRSSFDDTAKKRWCVEVVARLPTDEAFQLLLDRLDHKLVLPAVPEAARLYPRRAMRLLAVAATAGTAAGKLAGDLLRTHVRSHPDLAESVLTTLDGRARAGLASVLASVRVRAGADAAVLPSVLTDPPWTVQHTAPAAVLKLSRDESVTMDWLPGEQEAWAGRVTAWHPGQSTWEQIAASFVRRWKVDQVGLLSHGPVELGRPLIGAWEPVESSGWHNAEKWMPGIVARFGIDAYRPAFRAASDNANAAEPMLPFVSAEVADLMARWLNDRKAAARRRHATAQAWLTRHPLAAARALIPAALGRAAAARYRAVQALLFIDRAGHGDPVRSAAKEYGDAVAAAIEAILADPRESLPAKMPTLPGWLDPPALAPVLLRDRSAALPADSVRHLGMMLAISEPDQAYPGLEAVREACDPVSLAEFGRSLLRAWLAEGAPPAASWVLRAQQFIGDDETVRQLSSLIRTWPGEDGHARAVAGLDVLARFGTDLALMHLFVVSEKVKFRGVAKHAGLKIDQMAKTLGLSYEQLGDRLVPDLGLDAAGSAVLDYGARRFVVGFDEQLKPFVTDESGTRRVALPKPAKSDDEALAAAAQKRFAGLKKDVRAIAADQIARLERAMVNRRRWSAADLRRYFVAHPVLWHLTRRLVWATFDADGAVLTTFRAAEDRSFADSADTGFVLADDDSVGVAHPVQLAGSVAIWSEVFADYEILQPFPQLDRTVHRLTDAERPAVVLTRVAGIDVPTGRVLALERLGWSRRGTYNDITIDRLTKVVGGQEIVLSLDPPLYSGAFSTHQITEVWVNDQPGESIEESTGLPLGSLDAVTASELLRDLTEAASDTGLTRG
jgi:hypothetical protein